MEKLVIISVFGNIYHINMCESYSNNRNVKYIRIPHHKNDCGLMDVMKKTFEKEETFYKLFVKYGFRDVFDYKNMRLIWSVPESIVGKETFACHILDQHIEFADKIAEFYAENIENYIDDDYFVIIDISEAVIRNETCNVISQRMIQLLKQKYKKLYVIDIGYVYSVAVPKEVQRIRNTIKKYYSDCIVDRVMDDVLTQQNWNGCTMIDVVKLAEEIHNNRIWEIIQQIINEEN